MYVYLEIAGSRQAGRQELEEMQQHLGFGDTIWNNGV
jgi:hypothetical protein